MELNDNDVEAQQHKSNAAKNIAVYEDKARKTLNKIQDSVTVSAYNYSENKTINNLLEKTETKAVDIRKQKLRKRLQNESKAYY